jgi:predicted ATP-dependent Lon-type protease
MTDLLAAALPHASDLALALLASLASWLFAELARRVRASHLADTRKRVFQEALEAMLTAVLAVEQTTVSTLKASAQDGKLSAEEASEALASAVELARQRMGAPAIAALARELSGDVDEWLRSAGEAMIANMKRGFRG